MDVDVVVSGFGSLVKLGASLRGGRSVVVFPDFHAFFESAGGGIPIAFLGMHLNASLGIGGLARRTGAMLVPFGVVMSGGPQYRCLTAPPVDPAEHTSDAEITRELYRRMQDLILEAPEQWTGWRLVARRLG